MYVHSFCAKANVCTLTELQIPTLQAKKQGMSSLHLSTLAGMVLLLQLASGTTLPVASTHSTTRVRVPPSQVALHCGYIRPVNIHAQCLTTTTQAGIE